MYVIGFAAAANLLINYQDWIEVYIYIYKQCEKKTFLTIHSIDVEIARFRKRVGGSTQKRLIDSPSWLLQTKSR